MPSATKLSTSDSDLGWALKDERKNKRFNKNQTDYLYEKFNKGQKSGKKKDPYSVSEAICLKKMKMVLGVSIIVKYSLSNKLPVIFPGYVGS